jgi:hypothetical protein
MARKRHPFAPFVGGTLTPPPELPEATTLRELGMPFTDAEFTHIRTAMALYKAAKAPELTYEGWKVIGLALSVGEARAKQHAKGIVHSRGPYGRAISQFLNATGFAFLNKGVRWALRQWIDNLSDVDEWHASLDRNDRVHLNNPIDVWDRYTRDGRKPKASSKLRPDVMKRRAYPSLLEELQAVQDALEDAERRGETLELILEGVLANVPVATLERLPDELLRRVFARLPQATQEALEDRRSEWGSG